METIEEITTEFDDCDLDVLACFTEDAPELDFVFGSMLAETVGGLIASGGIGKTFLDLDIAVSICTGLDLTKGAFYAKEHGNVTYLNLEDGKKPLQRRMQALGKMLSPEQQLLMAKHFTFKSLAGKSLWLLDDKGNPVVKNINWLTKIADGQRLVIIDTLRRVHLADENNGTVMCLLLNIFENIASRTGCSILFCHHANKSAVMSGNADAQGASRGSSVITDNARFQMNMTRMTAKEADKYGVTDDDRWKFVKINSPKVNNTAEMGDVWLYRNDGGILTRAEPFTQIKEPRPKAKTSQEPTVKSSRRGNL